MQVKVVDASALGALLFGEPDGEAVAAALDGARLVAPALLWFEVASICLKKVRAHPDLERPLIASLKLLARMRIEVVAVEHAEVVDLARATGLTSYDASYLWLANRLGTELVTLDRRLAAAAP